MKTCFKGKTAFLGGVSVAVLSMALPYAAHAQTASGTAPAQTEAPASEDADLTEGQVQELVVVGVRQAEQSAIARKRTARTAQDSIVADDVGQFPDKNAAEAIARIAGVALDVADSGEQGGFTIRGQPADLIRIEVDGMSTLSTPFTASDQGGRSASVGDLSSDLIKSVDVIKGQTADMTSGGVGGTVRIEQRNGLDFKDPLYRINVQGMYHTLSKTVSPRINATATQKFFGGTLGVLLTGTYEKQQFATDYSRVSVSRAGYVPFGDLDNSPEKSFVTPFDPVAAAVSTKAGCAALPTTGINSRLNCYAQWEDFVPSYVRPGRQLSSQERLSLQARVDWRPTNNLTLFASYNPNLRTGNSQDYNFSITQPTGSTNASGVLASNIRNVTVNENHYVTAFDMQRSPTATVPVGYIGNLALSSQTRDIQRKSQQYYTQIGADWMPGSWIVKARVQYSLAKSEREDLAFQFVAPLEVAKFKLLEDSGLWTIDTPGVDLLNPASYYPVTGTNGLSVNPQQLEYTPQADRNSEWNYQLDVERSFDNFGPLTRLKAGIQHRVRDNASYREPGFQLTPGVYLSRARALDQFQTCDPAVAPAATPCAFGSVARPGRGVTDLPYQLHTLTTAQYRSIIDSSFTKLPGGDFFSGASNRSDGMMTTWGVYDAGKFLEALGEVIDTSRYSLDCLYECIASDGKTYKRPSYLTDELTSSAYAMADFQLRPFGMLIDGNVGVRYQRIKVNAQPVIDFSARTFTQGTDATSGRPTITVQNVLLRREVGSVQRTSEDYLPSLNLALWPVEDQLGLRYSIAKQRARPSILQLTGNATVSCGLVDPASRAVLENLLATNPNAIDDGDPNTDDEAEGGSILNQFVNRCTGRIGNPELKGYGATTQNLSLEWYPNRDTQLSAAVYQISVKTGRPENVQLDNYTVGGDTYLVDTYRDGPSGLTQRGFEIAGRTAFTFLPSFLKHMGGGFNYSYTKSNEVNTEVDLFTGIKLPPRSESKYYYNVNLWYDDGRLNARLAYQRRAQYYDLTSGDGVNRLPAGYGYAGTASTTSYYKFISPVYKTGNDTLDARASYNITKKIQLFAEGKNLLGNTIDKFTPNEYRDINGSTPYMFDSLWGGLQGRIFYGGVIVTF